MLIYTSIFPKEGVKMLQLSYEDVIKEIKAKTELSDYEIDQKIQEKMQQLSGLISKEGAANIIANQLGVSLVQEGMFKIAKLQPGMKNIELAGKVTKKFNLYEFPKGDSVGKVASFMLNDETAGVRVTLWNSQTDHFEQLEEGATVKIVDGYVKENNGMKEVHLNDKSKIIINPDDVIVGEVRKQQIQRKKISELKETDMNVELLGTIVQVFDMKFYPVCPDCNKKVQLKDNGANCVIHNAVVPAYGYVLNIFLDDGSGNIRVVFFKNQVPSLLRKSDEEIQTFKDNPELFIPTKNSLLGEMIKVNGKATKNVMFDRLEFIGNRVDLDLDPEDEIKRALENS